MCYISAYFSKYLNIIRDLLNNFVEYINFANNKIRRKENYQIDIGEQNEIMIQNKKFYSSYGEDYILDKLFLTPTTDSKPLYGFYVDIGAHHPVFSSNTAYFYHLGWNGINIEANPGAMNAFKRDRPRDINLNYAVTSMKGNVIFHLFGDENSEYFGSSSTINSEFADHIARVQDVKAKKITVETERLDTILFQFCDKKQIDFMSIDIEGNELDALKSNDWDKYRPLILVVEILPKPGKNYLDELYRHPIVAYLLLQKYRYFTQALYSCFFYDIVNEHNNIIRKWGF
jgi:FkbM family methyltransferase